MDTTVGFVSMYVKDGFSRLYIKDKQTKYELTIFEDDQSTEYNNFSSDKLIKDMVELVSLRMRKGTKGET